MNQFIAEALSDASKLPAEYTALGLMLDSWVPEDTVAIASQVGATFGKAGAGEVRNPCGLKGPAVTLG